MWDHASESNLYTCKVSGLLTSADGASSQLVIDAHVGGSDEPVAEPVHEAAPV